jgi:hypothetical protein
MAHDVLAMADDATTNEGWAQLLDEMDAMAADLDAKGWETLSIPAGDAAAVDPDEGHTDRHGYSYVVPGDDADTFAELFEDNGFPKTEVYRATTASHLFLLTVFLDPSRDVAILLAGVLERGSLDACREAAQETGSMYSHVFRVDGTHLGSFEHDDPGPFFPDD